METTSLQFLGFGVAVAIVYNFFGALAWRQLVLLLANLWFFSIFATDPWMLLPSAGFILFGFVGVRLIQRRTKTAYIYISFLLLTIALYIWLKKYTILPQASFLHTAYVTVGLSYIFFRVLHLMIDIREEVLPQKIGFVSYLNYTLNFTTFISGPIQLYKDFAKTHLTPVRSPLTLAMIGVAGERIAIGFFKVQVLSLLFSAAQTSAIDRLALAQPTAQRVITGSMIAGVYPIYLYCNFSGYMDLVIGLAALMRFKLPENFDRPFSSENFLDFWRRWHITLSNWFKTYFYNPLLMLLLRRKTSRASEPFLAVFAFFLTFFLLGVWHGRTSQFVIYGLLLGFGVSVNKLYQIFIVRTFGRKRYKALCDQPAYSAIARGLTYTYFSFSLLWFWSTWKQLAGFTWQLRPAGCVAVWALTFVTATVVLTFWEALRAWLLSFSIQGQPILQTRYARTVFATAAMVMTAVAMSLLMGPPPEIVYRSF